MLAALGVAAGAYTEYTKDPKASNERKASNAVVGGAAAGVSIGAGMLVGAAIGSIIPGPGTVIGAAIGAAVSIGAGVAASAITDYEINKKRQFADGKKSLLDETEDAADKAGLGKTVTNAWNTATKNATNAWNTVAAWF